MKFKLVIDKNFRTRETAKFLDFPVFVAKRAKAGSQVIQLINGPDVVISFLRFTY